MALNVRFTSLTRDQWPGPVTAKRTRAPFKNIGLSKILPALEKELLALRARNVTIRAFLPAEQIRLDGWPRANARATGPGVVLEFVPGKTKSTHRFYCDRYLYWEDNLLAIGRAMENLRAIDRWGVNKGGEQYAGYRAIAAESSESRSHAVVAAASLLARHAGVRSQDVLANAIVARDAWRRARVAVHPDRGGSSELFVHIDAAAKALGGYFGEDL